MSLFQVREMIIKAIEGTPFAGRTYLVGGAVRDQLMGNTEETWDYDLCVEMKSGGLKLGKRLRERTRWEENYMNDKFDFVRLDYAEFCLEITGTRMESYKPNSRFPKITYGNLLEDVYRRDFTINALMMEVFSGDIIDLSGCGIMDIEAGIIRTLKDPIVEFSEDPLRILRGIRFAAQFGFKILPEVEIAIRDCAPLLKYNPIPAQQREMQKMLDHPSAARANQIFTELDLYPHLHPSKLIRKMKSHS